MRRAIASGAARRRVPERASLPSARAVVGGLLMSLAAIGTLLVWNQSTSRSDASYVVATHSVHPGERLSSEDVELAPVGVADASAPAFTSVEAVAGRVALGPIGEGELVQPGQVTEAADEGLMTEVSFTLPRDRAVDGRLRSGDWVDVVVTQGEATRVAVERVRVVSTSEDSGLGGATREVVLTVGLEDPELRLELIHALHVGEVTLTRSLDA
jgi:Flp pilus assembly protein CpaB